MRINSNTTTIYLITASKIYVTTRFVVMYLTLVSFRLLLLTRCLCIRDINNRKKIPFLISREM